MALEKNPNDIGILEGLFRLAHNLKGSAGAVGLADLSSFAHQVENLLVAIKSKEVLLTAAVMDLLLECNDRLKKNVQQKKDDSSVELPNSDLVSELQSIVAGKKEEVLPAVVPNKVLESRLPPSDKKASTSDHAADESIRLSLSKIDHLLNSFGEQVILQSALEYVKHDLRKNEASVTRTITQLSKITADLQQTVISLRMVPVKTLFAKMERIVRDTSKALGKKIEFVKYGEESELDKTIIDAIADPLVHMVRNAVDHGVEMPQDRLTSGKDEVGKIWMRAFHRGGFFYIEIQDDGKGLDKDKIVQKAQKLGLLGENHNLSEGEIFNLIFSSGLTTKEQADDVSGRGVGMDVVKNSIERLKGNCQVTSELGVGSTFSIRLPLTLALFNGMVVEIGGGNYIFPNSDIEEAVSINTSDIRTTSGDDGVINVKGEVIPIIRADKIINSRFQSLRESGQNVDTTKTVLITKYRDERYALLIDNLISQQRIVHKNLGEEIKDIPGIAGGTILGDGKVALILELAGLIDYYQKTS